MLMFLSEKFKTRCEWWASGGQMVGLIGLEPMTLRLSSACSNQLSYRPKLVFNGADCSFQWENRALKTESFRNGGRGIRTPDIQLAKLALYQLSYTPLK